MTDITAAPTPKHQPASGGAFGIKGLAWAVFEWARNPYYNVIVIYVFAPYFANAVVGGGPEGQAIVADSVKIAGVAMAITAPILGVLVDKGGGKKGFIFFALAGLAICAFLLGGVLPDTPGAVPLGMTLLIVGYCCYTLSELLHNSILPAAGDSKALPMISGLGLAMGNVAGVLMLVFLLLLGLMSPWAQNLPGGIGALSGPVVGIWLALFIIPFFLFMPDRKGSIGSWSGALHQTFTPPNFQVRGNIPIFSFLISLVVNPAVFVYEKFKEFPNVMRFLLARMIYADGLAVLLTLGGVYVAGVLGWSANEIIIYGIMGSLIGALGGFVGGALDGRLGPKRALMVELFAVIVIVIIQISVTPEALFFGLVPAGHEVWSGFGAGLFTTLADVFYLLMIIPAAIAIVACITSSRYMLVHLAPPDRIGEFFGFYAMAGTVTVWIGPLIVSEMTTAFDNQRIGFAGIILLFIGGLAILAGVKSDRTPEHEKQGNQGAAVPH
ncbi:MAG: MFS transporter [Pseudomonadota bacterium]